MPTPFDRARVVLFDIDGTLLRTGNRVHGRSIIQSAREVTGHDIAAHFGGIDAGGRTDRYIVSELLRRCGLTQDEIDAAFPRIGERSVELSRLGLAMSDPEWQLPGASALIAALGSAGVALGLVTGNLPAIASLKLTCALLWEPFAAQDPLIAAFGDLSEDRNDLTRHALAEAQRVLGGSLGGADVVVIGDTPRDVECAHAIGAVCIGVATGRYRVDELRASGADHVVASLVELLA